ncbi:uncharacterized protein KY384_007184 [Bacidia gigantensis]|uniref:uncharacterized protein n=1 Tax=Bacidia gigantensis TaxID=2732470 RepID=UPI001D0475A2|nr:uncharacterized protein KY384_007184 [Bacidia gigantensis]KAG8528267.1 hypothetical protein KY384_007184 [Bacidia gigantensis]
MANQDFPSFSSLYAHILTLSPPLSPPPKPTSPSLTPKIASLSLHPTLEAALHILNNDLPSAHFLVRHMQAAPAYEGMFLHGILHRIEGDFDNARAWYRNVEESEVFRQTWGVGKGEDEEEIKGLERARDFISRVEGFVKRKAGDRDSLGRQSISEINSVVEFCRRKFGEGEVRDASDAFVQDDERTREIKQSMLTGGKGFREF